MDLNLASPSASDYTAAAAVTASLKPGAFPLQFPKATLGVAPAASSLEGGDLPSKEVTTQVLCIELVADRFLRRRETKTREVGELT